MLRRPGSPNMVARQQRERPAVNGNVLRRRQQHEAEEQRGDCAHIRRLRKRIHINRVVGDPSTAFDAPSLRRRSSSPAAARV